MLLDLNCKIFVCLVFYLLVVFLSSRGDTTSETLAPRWPFSQLATLAKQMNSSRTLLGGVFQVASDNVTTYFSWSVTDMGSFQVI